MRRHYVVPLAFYEAMAPDAASRGANDSEPERPNREARRRVRRRRSKGLGRSGRS